MKEHSKQSYKESFNFKISIIYWYSFFSQLWFYLPIIIVFFNKLHFNAQQIGYILFAYSMGVFLLEIPTGAIGDVYGRRLSIFCGLLIKISASLIIIFCNDFYFIVLANFLFGAGDTFISGSDTAYLYDLILHEHLDENKLKKIISNSSAISAFALMCSTLLGGILAYHYIKLPFILSGMAFTISIFFLYLLPKDTFRSFSGNLAHNIKESFSEYNFNRELRWISLYSILLFSFILAGFLLFQPYLLELKINLQYFGFILGGAHLLTTISAKTAPAIENYMGKGKYLFLLPIMLIFIFVFLSISLKMAFIGGIIFLGAFRFVMGLYFSIISVYVNKTIKPNLRATILSVNNLASNAISGLFYIISGYMILKYSLSMTLVFIASSMIICSLLVYSIFLLTRVRANELQVSL
jgi:MFS family permease